MAYYNPSAHQGGGGQGGMYDQLQFQDFSGGYGQQAATPYGQGAGSFGAAPGFGDPSAGSGSMFQQPEYTTYDDEPPLLEELEINFDQIKHKALLALNPMIPGEANLMDDTDLAGPLLFCLAYGGFLLLTGKIHFGYIYGVAMVGCGCLFALLNLMSEKGVTFTCVCSVLGYCLLPMVILSVLSIAFTLTEVFGLVLTLISVTWCTISAAKMFVHVLQMADQRWLIAYPCGLLYGVFALMTVF
eukprot:comp16866_c0_seq1/m.15347 comp16866_c0_seq1/g.15347  ORF comp16866_c0_seq1/g.15347 comp16866_c0_seq1/m.15347 type:complete len:243 (-) comp16866_c0_seq1:51-779(-)